MKKKKLLLLKLIACLLAWVYVYIVMTKYVYFRFNKGEKPEIQEA